MPGLESFLPSTDRSLLPMPILRPPMSFFRPASIASLASMHFAKPRESRPWPNGSQLRVVRMSRRAPTEAVEGPTPTLACVESVPRTPVQAGLLSTASSKGACSKCGTRAPESPFQPMGTTSICRVPSTRWSPADFTKCPMARSGRARIFSNQSRYRRW